jgi:cold shock CspA family protein
MRQGKVKWYNGKKCFGFITPDSPNENGNIEDVFVHSSSLKAADIRFLNENDIVEFEEEVQPRNGKLSVTVLKLIKRDEESAKQFQERRSTYRPRDDRHGGQSEDRGERRSGFAFWKK